MEKIIQKKNNFSTEWWDNFVSQNENFNKTTVYKDALTTEDTEILNKEILVILRKMFEYNLDVKGFRYYLDHEEQSEKFISENIYKHPPLENESIKEYAKRVFDDKKFAIIMNFNEKYSDIMAKKIRVLIDPLVKKIGIPLLGFEVTIFIGNYGFTPLGIHKDSRGENVIHFHLGPGKKIMYNWDNEVYEKVAKSKNNNSDVIPLLPHAKEYAFNTGDMYYMSWDKWHIGYSEELSVAVTLWLNHPTKKRYTKEMFKSLSLQYLKDNNEILNTDKDFDTIEPLLSFEEKKEDSFINLLSHVSKEHRLAILSNGGWGALPLTRSIEETFNLENDYNKLIDKTVIVPQFFKISYKFEEDELVFFARGYKMKLKFHKELESIIDKLNTHKPQKVESLIRKLIIDWPAEAALYFLGMIYDKKAFEII